MANAAPEPHDLSALLPRDGAPPLPAVPYDIVVIGMQESIFSLDPSKPHAPSYDGHDLMLTQSKQLESMDERMAAPQTTTPTKLQSKAHGDTFMGKMGAKIKGVSLSSDTSDNKYTSSPSDLAYTPADTKHLNSLISAHLPSYTPIIRYQRGEMRLHIYLRTPLVPALSDITIDAENTGLGHVLANKGGIAARVTLATTSMTFISCHLNAHEGAENRARRCLDLQVREPPSAN